MSHIHDVIDTDVHYKIDGVTRTITNLNEIKRMLVQNDHNSERLTFEMPRHFDGHDFSECNVVQVHYQNTDVHETNKSAGVYPVDDLHVSSENEEKVVLSWLVSSNATKYVGTLDFAIRFACVADDGKIKYAWNTTTFKGIEIQSSIFNSDEIVQENPDILANHTQRLDELELKGVVLYTEQKLTKEEQQQVRKNIGVLSTAVTIFGVPYESAEAVYDISAAQDGSLKMYIFGNSAGFCDAVVSGTGVMMDFISSDGTQLNMPHIDYRLRINRLHIEDGVTTIGERFMQQAYELRELTFANSKAITKLGKYAFIWVPTTGAFDFSGLQQEQLNAAFMGCNNITELKLSSNITTIAEWEFRYCFSLEKISGLDGVTSIGERAFDGCSNLEVLEGLVPNNVSLGVGAFRMCNTNATIDGLAIRDVGLPNSTDAVKWAAVGVDAVPKQDLGAYWDSLMNTHGEKGSNFHFDKIIRSQQLSGDTTPMGKKTDGTVSTFNTGCVLFTLYHIYNCLFQNKQYPDIYQWYNNLVLRKSFTVTEEMAAAWGSTFCTSNNVSVGDIVTALDMPNEGTKDYGYGWAAMQAMGWTRKGSVTAKNPVTAKQFLISKIAEEHQPVYMSISSSSENSTSLVTDHAIAIIGYKTEWDGDTFVKDSFLVCNPHYKLDAPPVWLSFEDICGTEISMTDIDFGLYAMNDEEVRKSMNSIDGKLDDILESINSGYHTESGSFTLDADIAKEGTLSFVCSPDWKVIKVYADEATEQAIRATSEAILLGFDGSLNITEPAIVAEYGQVKRVLAPMWNKTKLAFSQQNIDHSNGFSTTLSYPMKAGTYNWTAYYWNE